MAATRLISNVTILFLLSVIIPACASTYTVTKGSYGDPLVKVAILKGKDVIKLRGNGLLVTIDKRKGLRIGNKLVIEPARDGYKIGDKVYKAHSLTITGSGITVGDRPYRGAISIIKEGEKLTAVNTLGMENYIMGIINHEISSSWSIEAVKAQAVAARSYAYEKLHLRRDMAYHLESTVMDQVYGGSGSEDSRGKIAVLKTQGEVLFFGDKTAQALFHSSCGGHTESAENLWGSDVPYLRGVEGGYCTDAPNYFWTYITTFDTLFSLLEERGHMADEESSVEIIRRNGSGRVKDISIAGIRLSGKEFREMVGYGKIKSTLFDIDDDGYNIKFSGSGSGHGVGMCQWGAKGMAEEGFDYREVLGHYYPGTKLRRVY